MATVIELDVVEKIGALTAKVSAAHARIDKLEVGIREDLKELHEDLKELNAHMNKGKGLAASIVLLSGLFGAGFVKLLSVFLR